MSEQIIITVDDQGSTKVEVKGHAGSGCARLTEQLENDLGQTTKDVKTGEYYQQAQTKQTARRGSGQINR